MKQWFTFLAGLAIVLSLTSVPAFSKTGKSSGAKNVQTDKPKQQTQGQHKRVVQAKPKTSPTTNDSNSAGSMVNNTGPTVEQVRKNAEQIWKGVASPNKPAAGEQINWQVISSGGGFGSSTNYILNGTIGQTAAGMGTSTNFILTHGFQQDFSSGSGSCCIGITGNVDNDPAEIIDIGDLTELISFLFIPPNNPPVCMEEANVDGDLVGIIDIGDLTSLISFLFIPPNNPPAACQ